MLALGVARTLGQLVGFDAVHAPLVGEEQQPVVRGGQEEVIHHVVLAQLGALDALAAAVLGAVFVGLGAFDETGVGHGDHHVLFGDQVFDVHLAGERQDSGAAFIAVLGHDLVEFVADDLALAFRFGEDVDIVGNLALQFLMLGHDLVAVHAGQRAQLHGQDGVRLHLVDVQQLHKAGTGGIGVLGGADEGDDLVQHVQGLEIPLQDVVALLGLALQVRGAAGDHVELVVHPVADEGVQAQCARHAVDQGQHVGAEGLLQLGVLVQVVQHHLRHGVALQDQHEALAGAAGGLVAHVGNALDLAVAHGLADGDDETIRIDLVRQFGDHQAHAAVDLLGVDHGAHGDEATAGAVGLFDALVAEDGGAGGEVRSLDDADQVFQQFLAAGVRMVERPVDAVRHLAHVMRRDVGGHADGDAGGTVDEQVREAGRQHGRLLGLAVVVGHEVDGVLVDVAHHFHGQRGHAAFGVTHGGGRVIAGGAEVALAVDEHVAHRPGLGHTHQGVVDGGIAVRVVLTHHVADHAGALVVAAIGAVAAVVHRVDHTAMHGLHAVAHVRQGTLDDHGEGIRQVGLAHLLLQVLALDAFAALHQAVVGGVRLLRAQRLHRAVRRELLVAGVVFICHCCSFNCLSPLCTSL